MNNSPSYVVKNPKRGFLTEDNRFTKREMRAKHFPSVERAYNPAYKTGGIVMPCRCVA